MALYLKTLLSTVILMLACSVTAQVSDTTQSLESRNDDEGARKPIKAVAGYCSAIEKKLDAMDDTEGDTLLSDLPEADRAKLADYLTSLSNLRGAIHHDACDATDLKSAKAATRRDLKKHEALTNEMLAYAHHAMAEAYQKKQSERKTK